MVQFTYATGHESFGSHQRTLDALGAHETEVGDRMTAMMKPDIGTFVKMPEGASSCP